MTLEIFLWFLLSGFLSNLPASSATQGPRLDVDRTRGYMPPAVNDSRITTARRGEGRN